ncbi:hypothetical protein QBC47DRAFT_160909 [Echria macrotheca]|uniref:Uncharacterized protein n=1 Tax=Echria macrotheca TaxID=438768 RepID=A0AAJ0BI42_9PEZI|nr:hypothetical protein QBC47DRAFT_160909 [Echria macrotheca]
MSCGDGSRGGDRTRGTPSPAGGKQGVQEQSTASSDTRTGGPKKERQGKGRKGHCRTSLMRITSSLTVTSLELARTGRAKDIAKRPGPLPVCVKTAAPGGVGAGPLESTASTDGTVLACWRSAEERKTVVKHAISPGPSPSKQRGFWHPAASQTTTAGQNPWHFCDRQQRKKKNKKKEEFTACSAVRMVGSDMWLDCQQTLLTLQRPSLPASRPKGQLGNGIHPYLRLEWVVADPNFVP